MFSGESFGTDCRGTEIGMKSCNRVMSLDESITIWNVELPMIYMLL